MGALEEVTALLRRARGGEESAVDDLFDAVYDELRRLASSQLRREGRAHTLQTTALVHEAYLKLVDQRNADWADSAHFYAIAAMAIRRILSDYARKRGALKRGAPSRRVAFESIDDLVAEAPEELLSIDGALDKLARLDERKARVVELRFFAGLSIEDTAKVVGVSHGTVERDWKTARAWLQAELEAGEPT